MIFTQESLNKRYSELFQVPIGVIEKYNEVYGDFGTDVDLQVLSSQKLMNIIFHRLRICKIKYIKDKVNGSRDKNTNG